MSMRAILIAALVLVAAALGIYSSWRAVLPPKFAAPAPGSELSALGLKYAGLTYRQGTYSVLLTELPCTFEELRDALEAEDGVVTQPQAAIVKEGARRISGCWVRGIDLVFLQDMAGHSGNLPLNWFKREPGT